MGKRPSKSYRHFKRPNTRPEYIDRMMGVPEGMKHSSFGNTSKQFPAVIQMISNEDVQVSAKALVSIRVTIHRELRLLGENNFRMDIKAYPHHLARSHGLVGVAKAERIASGMGKGAYGFPEMRLARVGKGHPLLEIQIKDEPVPYGLAKRCLHRIMCKLPPTGWTLDVKGISEKTKSTVVTLPHRIKEKKGSTGGQQIAELQRELT